jgi:hypothetical protein
MLCKWDYSSLSYYYLYVFLSLTIPRDLRQLQMVSRSEIQPNYEREQLPENKPYYMRLEPRTNCSEVSLHLDCLQ